MLTPQPHANTYYAATAGAATDFPPLRGDVQADVCVIGAGFTGISSALALAERGYNVHVVEANRVGWGASGRNGGQMIGGISGEKTIIKHHGAGIADLVWEMRWAGHHIIHDRIARYAIHCDWKPGYAEVAVKARQLRELRNQVDELTRRNFPHSFEFCDANAAADMLGTRAYRGALINRADGHLHPLKLCRGEARAAIASGATVYEASPVIGIRHGHKVQVCTAAGSVTADIAVVAGNAYHLVEPRLRGMLLPVRSYIITTQALSEQQQASVNPADVAICDMNRVLNYFRLSADKRLLFGGRCNYAGDEPERIVRDLRPRMEAVYPQLKGTGIDYAWGGTIGIPVNRVPQIGRIAQNVFFAQGYSGHGVNVSHLSGQILADAIGGTLERFDVFAKIKPWRVPGGPWVGSQLGRLGVLFYQMRDLL